MTGGFCPKICQTLPTISTAGTADADELLRCWKCHILYLLCSIWAQFPYMDNSNEISRNIEEQQAVFIETLHKIRQRPGKQAVHDWRVSVKKIRSYLRLKEAITHELWKEEFFETRVLFGVMGKQRDVEMSQGLLIKFQKSKNLQLLFFKKHLASNLSLTRKAVVDAVQQYHQTSLLELVDKLELSFQTIPDPEHQIRIVVEENMKQLIAAMEQFKKNAHEIRKLLKDVYYWLKLLPEEFFVSKKEMKLLDTILDKLGQWQDHFVFHRKLKTFRKEILVKPEPEYKGCKMLEQEVAQTQEKLLAEAETKLSNLITNIKQATQQKQFIKQL